MIASNMIINFWCFIPPPPQKKGNRKKSIQHSKVSQSNMVSLMLFPCRSWRRGVQHEAGVEITGQDAVSEEALRYSLPRLPHHLPALPEPLHRGWLCAGQWIACWSIRWNCSGQSAAQIAAAKCLFVAHLDGRKTRVPLNTKCVLAFVDSAHVVPSATVCFFEGNVFKFS